MGAVEINSLYIFMVGFPFLVYSIIKRNKEMAIVTLALNLCLYVGITLGKNMT
jgi:hypothetical protein